MLIEHCHSGESQVAVLGWLHGHRFVFGFQTFEIQTLGSELTNETKLGWFRA